MRKRRATASRGLRDWNLIEAAEAGDGTVTLALELASDKPLTPLWPHAFRAVHRITVGATLTMALEVTNPGPDAFTFEEALHTYFRGARRAQRDGQRPGADRVSRQGHRLRPQDAGRRADPVHRGNRSRLSEHHGCVR